MKNSMGEWVRQRVTLERFAILQIASMVLGGLLAACLMRPYLEAGPVRLGSYATFAIASLLLAKRYYGIIKGSEDGRATIVVIASFLWWASFSLVGVAILFLILGRAYGFLPQLSENMQERILYFFISGAAIGALYKSITFRYIPPEQLVGRRVSAWPISWRRSQEHTQHITEQQDRTDEQQDRQERQLDRQDRQLDRRDRQQERP